METESYSQRYSDDEFSEESSNPASSPQAAARVHHNANVGTVKAKSSESANVKAILKDAAAQVIRSPEPSSSRYEEEEMIERATDVLLLSRKVSKKESKFFCHVI